MSRIDDLIKQLCPAGVPFKALGEVGTIRRGKRFVKSDVVDAGAPCIHYGEIYTQYGISASESFSFLSREHASRLRSASHGDVIIASAGETVEDIGKAVAWHGNEDVVIHDACYAFRSPLDSKYVAHFLQTDAFRDQARPLISSSKISSISTQNLAKVFIPVPPLDVQREVVSILDSFASLEAELRGNLEAELHARRRQHAFYRDSIMTWPEIVGVRRLPMREVATYTRGVTYAKSDEVRDGGSGHRVLRSNNIDLGGNRLDLNDVRVVHERVRIRSDQWLRGDDILVSAASGSKAHVGKVAFIDEDIEATFGGFMAVVRSSAGVLPRYLFHLLAGRPFADYLDSTISSTTIYNLTGEIMGNFVIPVPPVEEQERVVGILDKFEDLASNLSISLNAELKARGQQYKFYRQRLLTFREFAA